MIIIGITGTLGAGKGTIVDFLTKENGFIHFSVRGFLTELLENENLPPNRDNLVMMGNRIRANNSPSYIAEALYAKAKSCGKNCIIESIRTIGEANALKQHGDFYLLSVDADQRIRYDRIRDRASSTDHVSFEEFCENEKREMQSTDPNKQNLSACMQIADFRIQNNGSYTDLYQQIQHVMYVINNN